ncbi:MAG: hypothetical protein AAF862_16430 [Pseudomonadota bacterium]
MAALLGVSCPAHSAEQAQQRLEDAAVMLKRGQAKRAYAASLQQLEAGGALAGPHLLAGRSAFQLAQTAPLLSRLKWAKRGKAQFLSAYALAPEDPDVLLGLATLALRAPKGLGGGQDAYVAYKSQLAASNQSYSDWLEARALARKKQHIEALDMFARAAPAISDERFFDEYAAHARSAQAAASAYHVIAASAAAQTPCVMRTLAVLSDRSGADQTQTFHHLRAFLDTDTLYCERRFVALKAAKKAAKLASDLGLAEEAERLTTDLSRLRAAADRVS